jgi:hypothetical protein
MEPDGRNDARSPISAIEHYSYCARQYALIHVEQVFEENVFTIRGRLAHERVEHGRKPPLPELGSSAMCRYGPNGWGCAGRRT